MSDKTSKRFLVFAGDNYYPSGGWDDFQGCADSVEEAEALCRGSYKHPEEHGQRKRKWDWWHIIDLTTMQIVVQEPDYK